MRTVYLDSDFRCRVSDDGTGKPVETDFFDGKCDAWIEGYRFVPAGESWTRSDGVQFHGVMIAPWKDYAELDNAQIEYEKKRYLPMLKTHWQSFWEVKQHDLYRKSITA